MVVCSSSPQTVAARSLARDGPKGAVHAKVVARRSARSHVCSEGQRAAAILAAGCSLVYACRVSCMTVRDFWTCFDEHPLRRDEMCVLSVSCTCCTFWRLNAFKSCVADGPDARTCRVRAFFACPNCFQKDNKLAYSARRYESRAPDIPI